MKFIKCVKCKKAIKTDTKIYCGKTKPIKLVSVKCDEERPVWCPKKRCEK